MANIKLHSHACLEIVHDDFSLLIDPWLSGPAFLGSWIQFPEAKITPEELSPSAILISHEHSDHFHIPTLEKFARDVQERILVEDEEETRAWNRDHPNQKPRMSMQDLAMKWTIRKEPFSIEGDEFYQRKIDQVDISQIDVLPPLEHFRGDALPLTVPR